MIVAKTWAQIFYPITEKYHVDVISFQIFLTLY